MPRKNMFLETCPGDDLVCYMDFIVRFFWLFVFGFEFIKRNFQILLDTLNFQFLNLRQNKGGKLAALLEFSCGQHHVLFINLLYPFS